MPRIQFSTKILAPIERCFDLARSIDMHLDGFAHTGEEAIAGVTSGLIALNEEVTWRATHFGIRQTLTARITQFDRPHHFRDSMVHGAFAYFDHDHLFRQSDEITIMEDVFEFASPLGFLGKIADFLAVERYMTRLLKGRADAIKETAESNRWQSYLS